MADPVKIRLEKLRRMSDSARRRTGLYADIAKIDSKSTSNSLGALKKAPAPGKKLQDRIHHAVDSRANRGHMCRRRPHDCGRKVP